MRWSPAASPSGGPWPHVLPFAIHLTVTVGFLWLIRTVPETVPARGTGDLRSGLRVRSARHRRFVRVVAVCGPWLFIACGLSYGYQPVLLADAAGSLGLAYATLLSVIALGSGALIQPVAKRIDSVSSARGLIVALLTLLVGLGVMIAATSSDSLILGVCASVVLGAGFGIGLVSGLLEVQRIAPADELAKLTGVFYAVAYIGFAAHRARRADTAVHHRRAAPGARRPADRLAARRRAWFPTTPTRARWRGIDPIGRAARTVGGTLT